MSGSIALFKGIFTGYCRSFRCSKNRGVSDGSHIRPYYIMGNPVTPVGEELWNFGTCPIPCPEICAFSLEKLQKPIQNAETGNVPARFLSKQKI